MWRGLSIEIMCLSLQLAVEEIQLAELEYRA
jgi:hypothetical protein